MPDYIRNYVFGGTFFFTLVTEDRKMLFAEKANVVILLSSINKVKARKPFDLVAYCVMPDHLHLLITLPENEKDFSQRIHDIKRVTTFALRKTQNNSSLSLWQKRFWEHTIHDEKDLQNCFDYIHYNPVKHGYSVTMDQWQWSSYSDYFDSSSVEQFKFDPTSFEGYQNFCGE